VPSGGIGIPQWVGIGLAAAGIGMGIYGIVHNSKYNSLYDDYNKTADKNALAAKWKKVEDAGDKRNLGYIMGSVLLASGITVWFVF